MTSTISLPTTLARHTGGHSHVTTNESNLGEALRSLSSEYSLGDALITEQGQLQPYIRVVVDNRMLGSSQLDNPDAVELSETRIELKTAFAGG